MRGGLFLYKCRRCGETQGTLHVPDGFLGLLHVLDGQPLPPEWGGWEGKRVGFHTCKDSKTTILGVTDLVGCELDEEEAPAPEWPK